MGLIFGLAMAKVAEEQAIGGDGQDTRLRAERPRRRPGQTSSEWREERRRAS